FFAYAPPHPHPPSFPTRRSSDLNQNGVWPWREQDRILIPLEQAPTSGQPVPVEVFYSSRIGAANPRVLDLELLAPKFDLPLENRSEEHTSELQSRFDLVCRLLLE